MDLKQKLIDMAREATGDDSITTAGDFQPKGMTWKVAAGAAAGSVIGDAIGGDVAQAVGTAGGMVAGRYAATSGAIPAVVILAASPTKLYVMTSNNAKGIILAKSLLLIDTLDRQHLSVSMHQRVTTRTLVVQDESTGHEYALEGKRILFHHMNDMLDLLDAADEDGDE